MHRQVLRRYLPEHVIDGMSEIIEADRCSTLLHMMFTAEQVKAAEILTAVRSRHAEQRVLLFTEHGLKHDDPIFKIILGFMNAVEADIALQATGVNERVPRPKEASETTQSAP